MIEIHFDGSVTSEFSFKLIADNYTYTRVFKRSHENGEYRLLISDNPARRTVGDFKEIISKTSSVKKSGLICRIWDDCIIFSSYFDSWKLDIVSCGTVPEEFEDMDLDFDDFED